MWHEVADPNERVSPLMESRDQLERLSRTNGGTFARSAVARRHAVSPIALPARMLRIGFWMEGRSVMKTLRLGDRGPAARRWQVFLIGQGFEPGIADGQFGTRTEGATRVASAARSVPRAVSAFLRFRAAFSAFTSAVRFSRA